MNLRVLSFNIRYCQGQDGDLSWDARCPRVLEILRNQNPDLFVLQEVLPHQRRDLEAALPEYRWFGLDRQGDGTGEQCPVAVRQRFNVQGSTNFWLSDRPGEPGSRGWDASLPRLCTTVWLEIEGRRVIMAGTHLDHEGARSRIEGVRLIDTILDEAGTIVAGDFNCQPTEEPIQVMQDRFQDCSRILGPEQPKTTFHDFGKAKDGPQIDYIFCDFAYDLERFEILTEEGPDYSSDHFPVVAEIRYR